MTVEGRNCFGSTGMVLIPRDVVLDLAGDPYAYQLFSMLKMHHADRSMFFVANAMAAALGWTLPRFKRARTHLVESGKIICISAGGRGPNDPGRYRWP
jgi:hypothetical protein